MKENTLLSELTVSEFLELQKRQFILFSAKNIKYEYGLKGLAKTLGCSLSTASRIKKSGILDDAIFQNAKTIIIDKEKALQLFKENGR